MVAELSLASFVPWVTVSRALLLDCGCPWEGITRAKWKGIAAWRKERKWF